MSLSYFNVKKLRRQSKQPELEPEQSQSEPKVAVTSPPAPTVSTPSAETAISPVLDEEDEKFLERLASLEDELEGTPPPLPERSAAIIADSQGHVKVGKDAQEALMDGADKIPLPMSPPEVTDAKGKGKAKEGSGENALKKGVMDYFALAQSKFKRGEFKDASKEDEKKAKKGKDKENKDKKSEKKEKTAFTDKEREQAADDLLAAAKAAKATGDQDDAEKQAEDLTTILDQLNLSAVNNRVFSFSKESEELMERFKVVLKDLVNGVPTAYNDLEKLLTDSDTKLKDMYGTLPPFLQNLVKSLPAKMSTALAPELLAAAAEKPGFDAKQRTAASGRSTKTKKKSKRSRIPSLESLLSKEGAVATMLRSILSFLKLRFPALMTGTNVLLSLAVFLLLFVFWYCHKRGKEVRLEKEGLATQEGGSGLASSASSFTDDGESIKVEAAPSKPKDGAGDEKSAADLEAQLPSVANLPEPGSAPSTPAKEKDEHSKSSK